MVVKKLLNNIDLKTFSKSKVNLAPSLYNLFILLKSAKVTKDDLFSALTNVDGVLKNKLEDIYNIFAEYENYLEVNGLDDQNSILNYLPNVIENCKEKHLEQRINFIEANAKNSFKETYDTIICYMLLHELPPLTRNKVLENIIKSLKPDGKAIFIDYNLPSHYNPLKYFIRAFNRLYQPFAEALWKNNIKDLTPNAETCSWSKQTYFGGIYQKVVATKLK